MKTYNASTRCILGMLAITLLSAPMLSAQQFASAAYSFTGPNGDFRAHVGDAVTFQGQVVNEQGSWDALTVNSVLLVVHRGTGDVHFPNLAGSGVLAFPGEFAYFSTNVTVQEDDGDVLSMNCDLQWTHNSILAGGLPFPGAAYYADAVDILKPGVEISHQSRISPTFPSIAFDGMVTNTGNTVLHNLDLVSDSGTPQDPADDVTIRLPPLNPKSAQRFSGTYIASGFSALHRMTVRGTDDLGLTVTQSSTRAIPVALSIVRSGAAAIQISWPDWAEGFRLESCGAVGETWKAFNAHPVFGNGKFSVTLPMTTNQLYRLMGL